MKKKIEVVAIAGPTASGKTSFSVDFALKHQGEIVSCDSMQVYQHMNIGTAKVTPKEMQGVPHHMIDVAQPYEFFSVASYCEQATSCIAEISARGKLPIVVGGTGLYMDSLLNAVQFQGEVRDEELRAEILAEIQLEGKEVMHRRLAEFDPESAARIHENDTKRLVRAFEVYRTLHITMSEAIAQSKSDNPYAVRHIGLNFAHRESLYGRIDRRVDLMFEGGLVEEVKILLQDPRVRRGTAMQGIGYKEVLSHLDGKISLEEAVDLIKRESRRYAKRQITWFKRDKTREWILY